MRLFFRFFFDGKSFSAFDELITLLFGVFERCESARESALSGKLNHLGMDCASAKSTFNDALNRRNEKVFEAIFRIFHRFCWTAERKALVLSSFLLSIRP